MEERRGSKEAMRRSHRGTGYILLTLLFGAALFAIDTLPILEWMAYQPWEAVTGEDDRTRVLRSFAAVVAFNLLWAWGVHRVLRAILCARDRRATAARSLSQDIGTPASRRLCNRRATPAKV
jgi:hypothetical protein